MNIEIRPEMKIEEVQSAFAKRFPFLKLNFFKSKPKEEKGYTAKDLLDSSKRLMDVAEQKSNSVLLINGLMTVFELEKQGQEKLGLHIDVFRKSGKVWLRTSASDQWTLDEQNKEAKESEPAAIEKSEENDYHEQE
ncbi:MAG: hypothetical protein IPJ66_12695 [Bacteroidetes bacterium]|nr:hypothetical protein [Bacteroidota bacterium]MBL0064061.1 hypothetical protein [Bacteroidota bacterium]MBL0139554.1 hypothetical protein [Bacteroidota bacterium]